MFHPCSSNWVNDVHVKSLSRMERFLNSEKVFDEKTIISRDLLNRGGPFSLFFSETKHKGNDSFVL